MRARRLLIPLMMLLLLLPQAQAERLTLYTRPGQVDEATPFQLRPTELSICSVTRAMGGVVVLANDDNYDSLSLYFWQDGMTEMRKLGGGFYWVMSSDTMETAQESCEYSMSRVPNYRMPDLTHAISNLTSDGETLYALNRINGLIFKISEKEDGFADRRCLHNGESVLPEHQLSGLGDGQSIHLSGVADADRCLRFSAGNQRDAGKRHQGCAGGLGRRRHSRNCG